MIACYCRVSSDSQNHESQKAEIKRWLKGNKIKLSAVTWYEDTESGTTSARPALEAMKTAVFGGEVDTIVVWKLDRISRDMREGINLLADWCDRGLRVVSVTEQLDLGGTVGRIVASILFGMAEIQLTQIRERQAAGIALAKQRGVYKGRKKGTTKARPQRARELCEQGLTHKEIATAMQVSERTVRYYLQQCPKPPKVMQIELHLYIENNSKFVRGKKRAREDIERYVLSYYKYRKPRKDGSDYVLEIPYESDAEIDRIMDDLFAEDWSHADDRHCFIEPFARSVDDPERVWD
ncbi:MAG: recombinase family protein [Candidatus Tectomicrobia bacterium]|nr:recombinase family protein [Candidatus Tectomicrobia bacterium]